MRLYSRYYQNTVSGQNYVLTDTLKEGVVLSEYSKETGNASGNSEQKHYVSNADLENNHKIISFTPEVNLSRVIETELRSLINTTLAHVFNHGLFRDIDKMHDFDYLEDKNRLLESLIKNGTGEDDFSNWFKKRTARTMCRTDDNIEGYQEVLSLANALIIDLKVSMNKISTKQSE